MLVVDLFQSLAFSPSITIVTIPELSPPYPRRIPTPTSAPRHPLPNRPQVLFALSDAPFTGPSGQRADTTLLKARHAVRAFLCAACLCAACSAVVNRRPCATDVEGKAPVRGGVPAGVRGAIRFSSNSIQEVLNSRDYSCACTRKAPDRDPSVIVLQQFPDDIANPHRVTCTQTKIRSPSTFGL